MTFPLQQKRALAVDTDGSKRAKTDEEDTSPTSTAHDPASTSVSDKDMMDSLFKLDPKQLVDSCKTNDDAMQKLEQFVTDVKKHLEEVKEPRADAKAAKSDQKAKDDEAKRQEERTNMVDSNTCFECKQVADILTPCMCFQQDGVKGHGTTLCEECMSKKNLAACEPCDKYLCDSCDYQTCSGCKELACCTPCMEKDHSTWNACDSCGDVFCEDCSEMLEETCRCDSGVERVCETCSGDYRTCEACNRQVCDRCRMQLACGNDVILCEQCAPDYDCADCDYCAGYYGAPRFK